MKLINALHEVAYRLRIAARPPAPMLPAEWLLELFNGRRPACCQEVHDACGCAQREHDILTAKSLRTFFHKGAGKC